MNALEKILKTGHSSLMDLIEGYWKLCRFMPPPAGGLKPPLSKHERKKRGALPRGGLWAKTLRRNAHVPHNEFVALMAA